MRTDDADLGPHGEIEQRLQPVRLNDFDVVVKEQQKCTRRLARRDVVELRPVEGVEDLDDDVG
ncbi:MAG: hypothetical protein ACLQDM_05560, partial [Bradyrhizobium sp.]